MKKERIFRISCYADPAARINDQPTLHLAPRTRERADMLWGEIIRKVGSKYAFALFHQGNTKRPDSLKIIAERRRAWGEADELAFRHTAFQDFDALLNSAGGFWPSLRVSIPDVLKLADLYDAAQAERKDLRRAHRYEIGNHQSSIHRCTHR